MELKNQFDQMSIGELESKVDGCIKYTRSEQREMVEVLIYLKTSGRYKENKVYEQSSFYVYIEDRFCIRPGTYENMENAHVRFPTETVQWGTGLVSKVLKVCGSVRAKKTLEEMNEAVRTSKRGMRKAGIESIIEKNRTIPKTEKVKVNWHAKYENERKAHEETKIKLREAMKKIHEQGEQIERLKSTAKKITDIKEIVGRKDVQRIAQV